MTKNKSLNEKKPVSVVNGVPYCPNKKCGVRFDETNEECRQIKVDFPSYLYLKADAGIVQVDWSSEIRDDGSETTCAECGQRLDDSSWSW